MKFKDKVMSHLDRPWPAQLAAEHLSMCAEIGEQADPEWIEPEPRHSTTVMAERWGYQGRGLEGDREVAQVAQPDAPPQGRDVGYETGKEEREKDE